MFDRRHCVKNEASIIEKLKDFLIGRVGSKLVVNHLEDKIAQGALEAFGREGRRCGFMSDGVMCRSLHIWVAKYNRARGESMVGEQQNCYNKQAPAVAATLHRWFVVIDKSFLFSQFIHYRKFLFCVEGQNPERARVDKPNRQDPVEFCWDIPFALGLSNLLNKMLSPMVFRLDLSRV